MKIFTNKGFKKYVDGINNHYETSIKYYREYLYQVLSENSELVKKNKKLQNAKGGLTKHIHELESELAEAKEKLGQRYIVKELKPEKAKNMQVAKIKRCGKTSEIIRKIGE